MDLLWRWKGLHLQGELIRQDVAYTDAGRPATRPPLSAPGLVPDYRYVGGYGLLGYRLPWFGVMPYLLAGFMNTGRDAAPAAGSFTAGRGQEYRVGLNLRPVPTVTLKLEYLHGVMDGPFAIVVKTADTLSAQAAWSF